MQAAERLFFTIAAAVPAFGPNGGGLHIWRMKFCGCVMPATKTESVVSWVKSPATYKFEPENAKVRTDSSMTLPYHDAETTRANPSRCG
jgi:hypothetical protein